MNILNYEFHLVFWLASSEVITRVKTSFGTPISSLSDNRLITYNIYPQSLEAACENYSTNISRLRESFDSRSYSRHWINFYKYIHRLVTKVGHIATVHAEKFGHIKRLETFKNQFHLQALDGSLFSKLSRWNRKGTRKKGSCIDSSLCFMIIFQTKFLGNGAVLNVCLL